MKRTFLYVFSFKSLGFGILIFFTFLTNPAYSQYWVPECYPENMPEYNVYDYDKRGSVYVTKGGQGNVNWAGSDGVSIWGRCRVGGQDSEIIPLPTPDYNTNKNQIFVRISEEDFVSVPILKLQNNVTLVICGSLTIGTMELLGDFEQLNNVKIVICPGGSFNLDVLKAKNNVTLEIDGVLNVNQIDGQTANLCINSPAGTGVIQTPSGGMPVIEGKWKYGPNCDSSNPDDGGITLPIELLSFTPEIKPDRVELNWTTGSEINNDYFTIERSRDLYGWGVMGFVEGAGNSSVPLSYSFSDMRPLDGLGYYRLKQTDFDGQFKYYGPIAAHYDLGLEGLDFKVMKQYTNWVIAVPNDGVYQVEVYNLQGHRLHSERVENNLSIPAPQGAVVIRVTDGFERSASRVVM